MSTISTTRHVVNLKIIVIVLAILFVVMLAFVFVPALDAPKTIQGEKVMYASVDRFDKSPLWTRHPEVKHIR